MYDVFAPGSTPSTGRVKDNVSLKKSYHTFTADVTNAHFHVDGTDVSGDHRLSGWMGRPQWGIRVLYFDDCEIHCMAGDALEHAGQTSWQILLKSRVLTVVTQHHNSLQSMSWMFSLRFTWMISMALDRDPRWTWFKPISHRKSDSKSGQCARWP